MLRCTCTDILRRSEAKRLHSQPSESLDHAFSDLTFDHRTHGLQQQISVLTLTGVLLEHALLPVAERVWWCAGCLLVDAI